MAKNYEQLVKQIDVLKREAEAVKKKEVAEVIGKIKVAIDFYGLTPEELFGKSAVAKRAGASPRAKSAAGDGAARFSDGAGNTWVGRGPRPQWLRDAIASGKSLKDFAVEGAPAAKAAVNGSAPATGKAAGKKYLSAVKYRDDAGHEWSGRGPKPTWVKDALAAGKTLQDIAV